MLLNTVYRLCACCLLATAALAQTDDATPNGDAQPTAQPAATSATPTDAAPLMTRVLEVNGQVKWAPFDSDEWRDAALDEEYPPTTRIRTGFRSSVKLQVGDEEPYTAFVVDSAGEIVITEAYKTSDTKRVRIGVAHGKIRAGVAEGGLASDFTVDSPVATLSKMGTWNFGLAYTRGSDEFEIFLIDYGLVDALNKVTGERRRVLPGQAVRETMRRWLDQSQLARNVAVADILGQDNLQIAFSTLRTSGLGVTGPGQGGGVLLDLNNARTQQQFAQFAAQALESLPMWLPNLGSGGGALRRPEGFFGTGRADELIDVVVNIDSQLAKGGRAKLGKSVFQRAALQAWLARQRR